MTHLPRFFILCLCSCPLIFISCRKKNIQAHITGGPGVYIAGDNGNNPVLWKNGAPIQLSSSSGTASQVLLSGTDLYIAGQIKSNTNAPGGLGQYLYWKNGGPYNIGGLARLGSGSELAVNGGDVYYSTFQPWLNGSLIDLPGLGNAYTQFVSVSGTDVYFAGADSAGDAVYWKNGQMHIISPGYSQTHGTNPHLSCIYVSGTDVYVGGETGNGTPVFWKNGIVDTLHPSSQLIPGEINAFFLSGSDLYMTAPAFSTTGPSASTPAAIPAYWKNGVPVALTMNGALYGYTTSIFVSGTDVYVTGQTQLGPVYWKNGVNTVLSPHGSANSIFVQ